MDNKMEACPGPGKCNDQGCPNHYAEVEALKADAERLDWLDKNVTMVSDSERYVPRRVYWGKGTNKNVRQAIDAARLYKGGE